MRMMNFGCGFDIREGWVNVDTNKELLTLNSDIWQWDAMREPPTNLRDFDFILVNHVLCTMKPDQVNTVLMNLRLALKDGGKIEVIDMDLLKVFNAYREQRPEYIPIEHGNADAKLCFAISGYGTRLSLYTPMRMYDVLKDAGFVQIEQYAESEFDTRPKESLIVGAFK